MGTWSLSFKRSTSVRARAISDSLLLDMVISAETFWLQKAGNKPDEYEDAFCPSDRVIGEAGREFSFAIADGATDACFSGTWARQLVNAYCEGMFDPISLAKSLPELQRQWREHVASKGPLPWYVEQKADSGAFATLLGITLEGLAGSVAEGKWRAIAVGTVACFTFEVGKSSRAFQSIRRSPSITRRPYFPATPGMTRFLCVVSERWRANGLGETRSTS